MRKSITGIALAPILVLLLGYAGWGLWRGITEPRLPTQQLTLPLRSAPADIGSVVRIDGGSFIMGAPDDAEERFTSPRQGWIDLARPSHQETVAAFELGKYEVTAKEYCEFLNELVQKGEDVGPYVFVDTTSTIRHREDAYAPLFGYDSAPAIHVQYRGARRYCEWLGRKDGHAYRLPTEFEWEFAARGTKGRTYPWGEESAVGRSFLRRHYRYLDSDIAPGVTTVGLFPQGATPEGVFDMIGNAAEWCSNCFYEYTSQSICSDANTFHAFAEPAEDCGEMLHPITKFAPAAAVRGGQYIDRYHTETGWTRTPGLMRAVEAPETEAGVRGIGFRVLREVPGANGK